MEQIPDSKVGLSSRAAGEALGVSHVAVQRAIKSGRLVKSVRDGKVFDVELARREWAANTDLTDATVAVFKQAIKREAEIRGDEPPDYGEDGDLADSVKAEKYWKAKTAELKFKEAAGELVPAADVTREVESDYAEVRSKLLSVPSKLRQRDPSLTLAQLGIVEEALREALEALAVES